MQNGRSWCETEFGTMVPTNIITGLEEESVSEKESNMDLKAEMFV